MADQSAVHGPLGVQPLSRASILVVEDNEVLARFVLEVLGFAGHEATVAANICAAFEALERPRVYDLVLLDLTLSGTSSLPIADKLLRRKIPFVITSGHIGLSLQPCYRKAPYLTKPFGAAELMQAVEHILSA